MALVADQNGVLSGRFTIPEGITAGIKKLVLTGAGGSFGEANFTGEGTLVTTTKQQVTSITTTTRIHTERYDPLAQTFSMLSARQIGGVELFVTAKGDTPMVVQVRNTSNGVPNQEILAEGRLLPSQITAGQWNRWILDNPVQVAPNAEYALVVLCNDATGSVGIAEMGKYDATTQRWVTQQPYQVGVLLSSSNASTWTPHQDRDLTFRLLARKYTQAEKVVELGSVAVTDAADLIMLAMNDSPADGADSKMQLVLPDGAVIDAGNEQVVRIGAPTTGNIGVRAVLRSTQHASAAIVPGSQLVVGAPELTADYVTRAMDADATGCDVRVMFDAILPSGSSVQVFISGADVGDTWLPVTQEGSAKPLGDSVFEYSYLYQGLTEERVRVKLVLNGTVAARPFVGNLRVSVT